MRNIFGNKLIVHVYRLHTKFVYRADRYVLLIHFQILHTIRYVFKREEKFL